MGKWYVGTIMVALSIASIILLLYYPLLQPIWEYKEIDTWQSGNTHTRFYEYSYQSGYVKSDYGVDYDGDGKNETQSPTYSYYTDPNSSNNSYEKRFAMNKDAKLGGHPSLLRAFTNSYYMVMVVLVLTILSLALFPLAGLGKISPSVPKAVAGIAAVLIIASSLYLVFAVPDAIETDEITRAKYLYLEDPQHSNLVGFKYEPGNGTNFYWGQSYIDNLNGSVVRQDAQWGAGYGWWLTLGIFFLLILSTSFIDPTVSRKKSAVSKKRCPNCGGPMRFVPQYGEWYCDQCKKYLDEMIEDRNAAMRRAPAPQPPKPKPPEPKVQPKKTEIPQNDDDDFLEW